MPSSIIEDNLESWERILRLFEKTSGLTCSLYLSNGKRLIGPISSTPMGEYLVAQGIFKENQVGHRIEIDELIPLHVLGEKRSKRFADALTILSIPIYSDGRVAGCIFAGWIFDHFPDPIECERIARIIGSNGLEFWQVARMQPPISPEKMKIHEEMLVLLVSTISEQLVSIKELSEASRIKDELLALVSHELKTPLTSLMLRIQMLKTNKVSAEKFPTFIRTMEDNTRVQTRLVEDLLDAAKIITGKFSLETHEFDLKMLLLSVIEEVSPIAHTKELTISFTDLGGDYRFNGDNIRLKQCFSNIISNSVKFTPAGGTIEVNITRNISNFLIRFKDSGKGVDKNFQTHIFERFAQHERTNSANSGLGLGLFIVKRIVDLHHGSIELESSGEGKGTIFEISLPIEK